MRRASQSNPREIRRCADHRTTPPTRRARAALWIAALCVTTGCDPSCPSASYPSIVVDARLEDGTDITRDADVSWRVEGDTTWMPCEVSTTDADGTITSWLCGREVEGRLEVRAEYAGDAELLSAEDSVRVRTNACDNVVTQHLSLELTAS